MPRRPAYPLVASLLRLVRRAFPTQARARARRMLFEWLNLTWEMPSGVQLQVATYGDWIVYNEIFVSREYDRAIALACDGAANDAQPLRIVDLGANVGFFTLRCVDRLRERGVAPNGFAVTAVEAHPTWAREFDVRVLEQNGLAGAVRLIEGLVGERRGSARLYEDSLFRRDGTKGFDVPYVDLSVALAGVPRIDLLKCDIEGAEQRFIETYADVLGKVRVAVFELHANLCDTEHCRRLLADYGFAEHAVLRASHPYYTYAVWRPRP